MLELTDERGKKIYVAREAIAVIRPVVVKETAPIGRAAIMLTSGQTFFVTESVDEVLAELKKAS